jgi:hypothetical protein
MLRHFNIIVIAEILPTIPVALVVVLDRRRQNTQGIQCPKKLLNMF